MSLDLEAPAARGGSPDASPAPEESWRQASGAVDAIRNRFGDTAVGPARLLGSDGLQTKRPGDTQWGPSAGDRTSGSGQKSDPGQKSDGGQKSDRG